MVQVVGTLSKHVKEVVAYSEAKTSHVVGSVAQRLEKEIEAAAVSIATTSERNTQTVVDNVRKEFQAQLMQNRADLERRHEKKQGDGGESRGWSGGIDQTA